MPEVDFVSMWGQLLNSSGCWVSSNLSCIVNEAHGIELCSYFQAQMIDAMKIIRGAGKRYGASVECANRNCHSPPPYSLIDIGCLERSGYTSEPQDAPIISPFDIVLAASSPKPGLRCLAVDGITLTPITSQSNVNQCQQHFYIYLVKTTLPHSRPTEEWNIATALKQEKS